MDASKRIAQLVREACIEEVGAPKPGNVNRAHNFSNTAFEDFIASAEAILPAFENADHTGVGRIVLQAITDCRRLVRSNTNLGIVLLLAPLAKACLAVEGVDNGNDRKLLRRALHDVLHALTVEDARFVYEAIRIAAPGGMNEVPMQDIAQEPTVTLLEAMELAKGRDSIAFEYITDFEITFTIGLPSIKKALSQGLDFTNAIVTAFLSVLSRVPDTLIARKNGKEVARRVSQRAEEVLSCGGVRSSGGRKKLQELDRYLRDPCHKLNPGTTADLTAAAIFLVLFETGPRSQGDPPAVSGMQ
ncbi:MAG: triphosphoribosyl-dephospho-CoA synthase [Acidobacteriota bacterium]